MTQPLHCVFDQTGLIHFSGGDAQTFLHNQLTCDVAALVAGRSTYGAYCTPKGRALASFLLIRTGEGFFMQLPAPLREPIQKQLSKFILRAKVKVTDASADWKVIGIAGSDAGLAVQNAIGQFPSKVHDVVQTPGAMAIQLPGSRFEVFATQDQAPRVLESLAANADKADADYWERAEIEAGIPNILAATQEAFVPQMVNLDLIGGVSLTKGCYPGQEIVARMHYRGTLKQRMYRVHATATEAPQPGDKLYSPEFGEQACGTIVNAAPSPEGGFDALAVIQISVAEKRDVRWKSLQGPALDFQTLSYPVG